MIHQLPPLPYAVDALEPHIDARTMTLHHDMHHAAYVKALNTALSSAPDNLRDKTPAWLLSHLDEVPSALRNELRHQAGGHLNHSLLWTNMCAQGGGTPSGALAVALARDFVSFEAFKTQFDQAADKHFGAGWVWLVMSTSSVPKLHVMTTNEHDNPLADGYQPLLVNDLWEHAYYLKHENRRPDYVKGWWSVVDWQETAGGGGGMVGPVRGAVGRVGGAGAGGAGSGPGGAGGGRWGGLGQVGSNGRFLSLWPGWGMAGAWLGPVVRYCKFLESVDELGCWWLIFVSEE